MKISKKLLKNNIAISILGSKSVIIRHLLITLFHNNEIILRNIQLCDDVMAAINILKSFGKTINFTNDNAIKISGQINKLPEEIYCSESATLLRMLVPINHSLQNKGRFTGDKTLLNRDFGDLKDMLTPLGLEFSSDISQCGTLKLPFSVFGNLSSQDNYSIKADKSSQAVSGLLISRSFNNAPSTISCSSLVSAPYVYLTADIINMYGKIIDFNDNNFIITPQKSMELFKDFFIEGDWSLGAMILALGLTIDSCEVKNLTAHSSQPDSKILKLFDNLSINYRVNEKNMSIITHRQSYPGYTYDITDTPDLVPALMILAANANSPSRINGINRLTNKETNRAITLLETFIKLGGKLEVINENTWLIYPSQMHGGKINSYNDHRVALLAIFLGLQSNEVVEIDNWECINKSYSVQFLKNLLK
jgi:3-phosphoshikimate 1-carboxyvinyltransferase